MDRREFLQATGLGVAGVLGVHGAGTASGETPTIRLEARQQIQSAAAYANDAGVTTRDPGILAARDHWEADRIGDDILTDAIDNWTTGTEVSGEGGPYHWYGVAPEDIADQQNPTLQLLAGQQYRIEISNDTLDPHEFVIVDSDGNEVLGPDVIVETWDDTRSITFTATTEMAEYRCANHPEAMSGTIDVGESLEPDPTGDRVDVLYFGGIEGANSTHYPEELLTELAPFMLQRGIALHYTERQDDLNPDTLSNYDAVFIYGNRLDATTAQLDALINFVENGGGFFPLHSASFCFNTSSRYVSLVGGQFSTHPAIQSTTTDRQKPSHPVFENVPVFSSDEEPYRHTSIADDITVLEYGAGADYGANEDEPWTWTRTQGDGRVFYTAWGHSSVWTNEHFKQLVCNGLLWCSGNEDRIGTASGAPAKTYTNVSEYGHSQIPYRQGDAPNAVDSNDDGTWDQVQDPFNVADSMQHSVTPAEFELEYFVSEDILPDGIEGEILDIAFDAGGRCFVALTKDYPNDGGAGNDQIVICEDTDGDGVADDFTVFRENLSIPHSMIPHENGVIVAEVGTNESGRVVYFGDDDGDDKAEVEDEIFNGYGTGDTHAGLNRLYRGIDNWIYGCVGYAGLTPSIDTSVTFSQDVFRFKPDGSEIEFVGSGASNMAGVKMNEEGLLFCSSATAGNNVTTYAAIPARYYDLINAFEGIMTVDIRGPNFSQTEDENRALPIHSRYRAFDYPGGFTAATDQEIYSAREFPEQYWNSTSFVGEGTSCVMSTYYLEQTGASYESTYHHNLYASNDEWSKPTYLETGPDGMIWMIDMYDFIFQHNPTPEGYQNGAGNAYVSNVRDSVHNRLYRVTSNGDANPHPQDLRGADASELVAQLSNTNKFWRDTAQRLLVERNETGVVSDLVTMATSEDVDSIGIDGGSIHALWTLEGLGAVEANADQLRSALTHSSAGVRISALRVLPKTAATRDAILNNDLLNDTDQRVRMWALLALAETPASAAAGEAIFNMIDQEANLQEDLLVDAASVGGATHYDGFLPAYESKYGGNYEGINVLSNGGFESREDGGPDAWTQTPFGGTYTYNWADGTASSGGRSLEITSPSSSDGADAAWTQTVSVETNTDYTFTAQVKTENVQTVDGTGVYDGAPFGAAISVEQLANDGSGLPPTASAISNKLTGTNDWTELTVSFNSGDLTEITFNCLFGGYGNATGTAYYDQIRVVRDSDGTNILSNSDVESGVESPPPVGWTEQTWGGSGQHAVDTSVSHLGDNSVSISSGSGIDGAWYTTVDVEPNSEYTLVGWIKTENVDGAGAAFNVHGTSNITNRITGTQGWTEVNTTFTTGAETNQIQINALLGANGNMSTGTAWFDDVELYDPDGQRDRPNLFANPSFEESQTAVGPDGWQTTTFGGTADYSYTDSDAQSGSYSVEISSSSGADAVWYTTVTVQPNTEYELSGYINTENLQTLSDSTRGALFNVHGTSNETGVVTGTSNGWQQVSTTFTTGADQTEIQINALFGGYGDATGTARYDNVSLVPTAGGSNLLSNGDLETGTDSTDTSPTNWSSQTWAGSATFAYDDEVSRSGNASVRVESANGVDGAWYQTYEVEQNTDYRFSAYIKTGDDFSVADGFGATINVHQLGQNSLPDTHVTSAGQDWTKLETTINSGSNTTLQFNCLMGGWGNASGTAWWDDAELNKLSSSSGTGIQVLYDRVQTHVQELGVQAAFTASKTSAQTGASITFDASASSHPSGSVASYEWDFGDGTTATGQTVNHSYGSQGSYTVTLTVTGDGGSQDQATETIGVGAIDPSTTITLDGASDGWQGTGPTSIDGETNPTLILEEGQEYTVEWTNRDGLNHNFALLDNSDNQLKSSPLMDTEGETQTVTFTATADMVQYQCNPHNNSMNGEVIVV